VKSTLNKAGIQNNTDDNKAGIHCFSLNKTGINYNSFYFMWFSLNKAQK